jgi:antitoxin component of RelBE/YafQ-DinJ toxin-antitoxin module
LSTASTLLLGYVADFTHLPISLALDTVVKTMQTTKPTESGTLCPGARSNPSS